MAGRLPRNSGGHRAGRGPRAEGPAPQGQRSSEDPQPHGRSAHGRGARQRGQAFAGRDREAPGPQAQVGGAPTHARAAPGPGTRLTGRSRPAVAHAGERPLRLPQRRPTPSRRRHPSASPLDPRDGRASGHVARGARRRDAGGAPARSAKRAPRRPRARRLAAGPNRRRDRGALRPGRARPGRADVRGLLGAHRGRAPSP